MRQLSALCVLILSCFSVTFAVAKPAIQDLCGEWRLNKVGETETIPATIPATMPATMPATVPGCVHTDLLCNHKIEDPYYRDNQKSVQWVGESTWHYSRNFNLPADSLLHRVILLRCEGLDTVATVMVNSKPVAKTDNMFRTYEFDIKPQLKPGDNSIEVTFAPVGPYIKDFIADAKGPNSSGRGLANVRKAPYSGGWDFGPKLLTCGIYKKIELIAFDEARITTIYGHPTLETDGRVTLDVSASVQSDAAIKLHAVAKLSLNGFVTGEVTFPLVDGTGHAQLSVINPQLWWPNGMGAHPLYTLKFDIQDSQGKSLDSAETRVGLRKVELLPKTAQRPLRLAVNGQELFAKGLDWIPLDLFPSRVTTDRIRQYISDASEINTNMIRCWGGGYYEEDAFYDACDESGILVWTEFKFACAVYPGGNVSFADNVRHEVDDQVVRLRNHPSIAVWCGNNEVTSLITGYKILKQKDYDAFFQGIIGTEVKSLVTGANYVGGSPEAGDEHNWWVWHVGANFEKYRESHGWMTEFGFQSFPCPATVESYTEPQDRLSVLTPVMKAHQHNGNGRGNEMIVEMMGRYFRPAKDFDSTLWLSQINQAYGVTMGIEHWRSDWPASSGALVWQNDDCWPGATWSSVDYFGRWKALQYKLRQAMAPVMVTAEYDRKQERVHTWVCSDLSKPINATVRWTLTDVEGNELDKGDSKVGVPIGTTSVKGPDIALASVLNANERRGVLAWLDVLSDEKVLSSKTLWLVKPKDLYLVDPQLSLNVSETKEGFDVTVTSKHPALWTWLDLAGDPDAKYSDNFSHVSADRPLLVQVKPSRPLTAAEFRKRLKVRSLFDTCESWPVPVLDPPAADGCIVASAATADIVGNAARLESGNPPDVGNWTDVNDRLEWHINLTTPGDYQLSINASCPPGTQDSDFELLIEDQHLKGKVQRTAGWTDYKTMDVGKVHITRAGKTLMVLKPVNIKHQNLMNLRSITLKPVPAT